MFHAAQLHDFLRQFIQLAQAGPHDTGDFLFVGVVKRCWLWVWQQVQLSWLTDLVSATLFGVVSSYLSGRYVSSDLLYPGRKQSPAIIVVVRPGKLVDVLPGVGPGLLFAISDAQVGRGA